MDVFTVWVDLEGSHGIVEGVRVDIKDGQQDGGDIKYTISSKKGRVELKSSSALIYTDNSKYPVNVFEPSHAFEYFHGLVSPATANHFENDLAALGDLDTKVSWETIQDTAQRCWYREEKFVHALVSVWLEQYLARNNNFGLSDGQVEDCFSNLDREPYLGARKLMPIIKEKGAKAAYTRYNECPDELFAEIGQ